MKKFRFFIQKSTMYVYAALFAIILLVCVFCGRNAYYTQKSMMYSNAVYLLAGVLLIAVSGIALSGLEEKIRIKNDKKVMLCLNVLLGIFLLGASYHYYFKTGWDAGVVIDEAVKIADGNYGEIAADYFSRCYNNTFITVLFSWVLRIGRLLPFGNDYFYLVMLLCVIWSVTGQLVYCAASLLCRKKWNAVLAWVLYLTLVGMSPWVVVPYTDTVGILFLSALLYLYAADKIGVLSGLLLVTGYYVKPQILIIGIAFVIIELLGYGRKPGKKELARLAAGAILGLLIVYAGQSAAHIQVSGEEKFGIPHYLMLGLNEETNGVFSEEDYIFSQSFANNAERNHANLREAGERIREMGADGLLVHLKKKLLEAYGDGSMAWGTEGGFFKERIYSGIPQIRDIFWNMYFPDGRYYSVFLNGMQTIWMGILFFCAFALKGGERKSKILVSGLSIIGLTLFELLFEVRARHLLIYLPVYILLACTGFDNLLLFLHKKGKKKETQAGKERL